jgi:uncharacterized protein YkwD
MIRFCLILSLGFLTACGPPGSSGLNMTTPSPTLPSAPTGPTASDVSFANLLNSVRVTNGVNTVTFNPNLTLAAQAHADDMLAQNYFSHTGLNGSSPGQRITAAGYVWRAYGENIAQGQTSQSSVLTAWTNSPGHHANDISPNFDEFGLGRAGSGSSTRWVLVLASD